MSDIAIPSQTAQLFYFLVRYADIELIPHGKGTMILHCDYIGACLYLPLPIEQVKAMLAEMRSLSHV